MCDPIGAFGHAFVVSKSVLIISEVNVECVRLVFWGQSLTSPDFGASCVC